MGRRGRSYVFVCAYARRDCVRVPFVSVHVCVITYMCVHCLRTPTVCACGV